MALTDDQKNSIINKYKSGHTINYISKKMGISQKSVHFWIKRYKQNQSLQRKIGSGIRIKDMNIDN